ncbi:MAG: hypothetical protein ABIP51_05560 [Bacteroidia bacterium]
MKKTIEYQGISAETKKMLLKKLDTIRKKINSTKDEQFKYSDLERLKEIESFIKSAKYQTITITLEKPIK